MALNVFTASGNIGKDCESRVTPAGKTIASFSLPVKSGYGENEKTSWVTCKLFGVKAEKLPQYLTKGIKVTVSGEFVLEQWEKDGVKHSMPCVLVNALDFGGSKSEQGGGQQGGWSQPSQQPAQQQPVARQQAPQNAAPQQQQGYANPPIDYQDDIPFAPIGLQYPAILLAM